MLITVSYDTKLLFSKADVYIWTLKNPNIFFFKFTKKWHTMHELIHWFSFTLHKNNPFLLHKYKIFIYICLYVYTDTFVQHLSLRYHRHNIFFVFFVSNQTCKTHEHWKFLWIICQALQGKAGSTPKFTFVKNNFWFYFVLNPKRFKFWGGGWSRPIWKKLCVVS